MYGTILPSREIWVYVIFTAYSEIYIELCQMIHYLRKRIFPQSRVGNGQRATASALPAECRYAAQVRFQSPLTMYKTHADLLRDRGVGSTSLVKTLFRHFIPFIHL